MTDTSKWVIEAPRVIAHRGASAYAPENTLTAFKKAATIGADAIELDAKLLKDGTVIVLHDQTVDRTTNASGSIYQFAYKEIMHLDAGSHFSSEFKGLIIPTLEKVFVDIRKELLINVELTNYSRAWDSLVKKTITLIEQYELCETVLLSSFNPWSLIQAKRINPAIARALLVGPGLPRLVRLIIQKVVDYAVYHPHHSLVDFKLMTKLQSERKLVNAWTVNEKDRMQELIKLGIRGIITDYPDVALNTWQESNSSSNQGY